MRTKLVFLMLLCTTWSFSQIQENNVNIINDLSTGSADVSLNKSTSCGMDTVQYTLSKATGLTSLSINNATSADAIGQYFNVPQPLTISGAEFYAYKIDAVGGITMNATVSIYAAAADSTATGVPLATTTVSIDTTFGAGALSVLRKEAIFTPITVTAPYVIVVENASAIGMGLIFSDYNAIPADGGQEWLADARIGGNWLQGYNINVGGVPFDADMIINPYTQYDVTADFSLGDICMAGGPTVTFTNNSSPVFQDRMYSIAEFLALPELQFSWDYGDGSAIDNVIDGLNVYPSNTQAYEVTLTDTLFGWTSNCVVDTTIIIGDSTVANYTSTPGGAGLVDFFDASFANTSVNTYFWDFGDGNTSTLQNPTHTYAATGVYTVCLTVTSACGTDTYCDMVSVVVCSNPVANFNYANNDPSIDFTDASTTTGLVTYLWDFGDGNTSTLQNPSHSYLMNGVYIVTLTITDDCGTHIFTDTIVIANACVIPTAGYTYVNNDPTIDFTDASTTTGTVVYSWDFGDGNTSNLQNPSHTYTMNGTYPVVLTIVDDCGTHLFTDVVIITNVCEDPIASFTQSGAEPDFIFTNTSTTTGSASYAWDMGDGTQYSIEDPAHSYLSNGVYTVTLVVTDSCGIDSTSFVVTVVSVSLDELFNNNVSVYPNPAKDKLMIQSDLSIEKIEILDFSGRVVYSSEAMNNEMIIQTSEFAEGEYLVKVQLSNQSLEIRRIGVVH